VIHLQVTILPILPDRNFQSYILALSTCSMIIYKEKAIRLAVLSVGVCVMFIASFASHAHLGLTNAQLNYRTPMQTQGVPSTQGVQGTTADNTSMNIILVHGAWVDGSSWSKVIPILENAGIKLLQFLLVL
jgi:hypothetical protein